MGQENVHKHLEVTGTEIKGCREWGRGRGGGACE